MVVSLAVWHAAVKPEAGVEISPEADLRITNIALSDNLADTSARTTVRLVYIKNDDFSNDEEEDSDADEEEKEKDSDAGGPELTSTILCSLTPGKIEQATVDVTLTYDDQYAFEVIGPNEVYITGNYVDQRPNSVPFNDGSEPDSDEEDYDEEGYDLRDVSSDVEMDPRAAMLGIDSGDEGRFEEIHDDSTEHTIVVPVNSKKRARESDAASESTEKLTKAQKKAIKKLKAESGEAVPSPADATKANGQVKDKKEKEQKKDKAAEPESPSKPEPQSATKTLDGGIQVTDEKAGKGPQAKKGQTVSMRYIGKLANGKIFDSNTRGKPFSFTLGKGEVIKGWDLGIAGMQVGGERKLVIPPKMGYGKQKSGPIPPNSTLTFEVKMVDIR